MISQSNKITFYSNFNKQIVGIYNEKLWKYKKATRLYSYFFIQFTKNLNRVNRKLDNLEFRMSET